MWVDSHAHLDTFESDGTWPDTWAQAQAAGVQTVIAIGGSTDANQRALAMARSNHDIYAGLGYDRDAVSATPDWDQLQQHLTASGVVGVGETGLDYHYGADQAGAQQALLERNLEAARAANLPVVIHTREAEDDTVSILRAHVATGQGIPDCPGVIHCFTGDAPFARRLLDLGFMISFSGIVTFKKSDALRAVLPSVPLDRLLIETDAPYCAPVPKRGKRNEPAFVAYVGECVAAELGMSVAELASQTTTNAQRLFRFTSAS